MKSNEYTTGGVHTPKNHEDKEGVHACSIPVASTGTNDNNPNVNNVDPGDH